MNNEWALLPMRSSTELLGDPAALRARLAEDSYLYFSGVLDPSKVLAVRSDILRVLDQHGWVEGGPALLQGVAKAEPTQEGEAEYAVVYDDVQRVESFHTLAHDECLMSIMREVLGDTAFPHPLKIARLTFPDHGVATTAPHQDFHNNQGTENLTAAWIPVGDCPRELGSLAILRGSHLWGPVDWTLYWGPGLRTTVLPQQMLEECRWVTTDFEAGDVLVFPGTTVHASLHNATEVEMRLSVDFRYQLEGEALTVGCLEPHFGRVTWEEIYADWESDEHQYYWKSKQFEVVPFVDEIEGMSQPAEQDLPEGWESFTKEDWRRITRAALSDDQVQAIAEDNRRARLRYRRRVDRIRELRDRNELLSDAPEV